MSGEALEKSAVPERTMAPAPVIVGVDGSDSSLRAVDFAARDAALRHRPLRVIHASIWPLMNVPMGPSRWGPPEGGFRHQADRILREGMDRASRRNPGVQVTGDVLAGAAAPILVECSRSAEVTVVADRGLGGFTGLLVGSVAVTLAAYGASPVVVVRGENLGAGPVVVGVDGSPANQPAIGYAFEAAALRRTPLLALHAWALPHPPTPRAQPPRAAHLSGPAGEEERLLSEALAGWAERYPDVEVRQLVEVGDARAELLDASKDAQLLVVGTRGRGGFAGLLLGSVSQAAIHHAHCPVAIVPDPSTRPRWRDAAR